ncbi:unnamed protein product [Diatraea saccharalis]|uniref:3CxxC-type domain-containing protein n=1 Tax=Diatraea saccharalis TaxID=40085 RepID=A0A9P0BYB9_9NEOP|nr:unnamed protein product [Diatraea saccharalis]
MYCNRIAVNNLVLINNVCEDCSSNSRSIPSVNSHYQLEARYGEYRCSCGRFWTSSRARNGIYQMCERCRRPAYPINVRPLRPSDMKSADMEKSEHKKELCQMCQQLGDCGRPRKGTRAKRY